jgi:hypothetical protein
MSFHDGERSSMGRLNGLLGNRQQQDSDDATQRVLAAARVGYITRDYAHLTKRQSVQAMTREAWLACSDPLAMLCFLHGRASGRKFRLFATACARDEFAQGTIPENECPSAFLPHYLAGIAAAEAFADGDPALTYEHPYRHWVALPVCDVITDEDIAHSALGFDADVGLWIRPIEETVPQMISRYRTHPAHYLRDIFGFVFHQGALSPAFLTWHEGVVVRLAQAVYDERLLPVGTLDPGRLAVLADALEETGCTDTDILGHLRGPGPHVRGCWTVDLCLGKS